VTAAR